MNPLIQEKIMDDAMPTCYQVYRLTNDGFEQSCGYYMSAKDADNAYTYYSEVRYPNAVVEIRGV